MARTSRLQRLLCALAFVSAACGRAPAADSALDGSSATDIDAAAVALDAADSATDAAPGAETAAGLDAVADTTVPPHVSTITVTLAPGLTLPPGRLHVRLVNYFVPVSQPTAYDDVVFDGAVSLPVTGTTVVPNGTWWPVVAWLGTNDQPLASNLNCDMSGVFTASPSQPAPDKIAIVVSVVGQPPACGTSPAPIFLSDTSNYIVPFTDAGVTHLLEGVAWNGAWWMAANADGIGRVDAPGDSQPVNNWHPLVGKGACRHVARLDKRLFCSQRNATITWTDIDPASNLGVASGEIALPTNTHAEGMLARDGVLYATLHEKGLAVIPVAPAGPALKLTAPGLTDTWHVAGLSNGNLVVANGASGIAIVAPTANALTVLATLALPGMSAHLAVDGNTVAVGALGGGMHLVDVTKPDAPVLLGTLPAGPWPIFGVELLNGMAYAAAARGVLAVQVPPAPVGPLRASAFAATDVFMTLDVRASGNSLLTAEYALVRSITLQGSQSQSLPIAVAEVHTWANVVAVGASAHYVAWVWNPGAAPLHVSNVEVLAAPAVEQSVALGAPLPFVAPAALTVAPGESAPMAISIPKTAPGVQAALLRFQTDDPYRPFVVIRLTESPFMGVGQPLPELKYEDAKANLVDVVAELQGKPALLIVSAESCPVAFERQVAVMNEYAALAASGKLAALLLNPWDMPGTMEVGTVPVAITEVFSAMTTSDTEAHSSVSDEKLALPTYGLAPQLPHVYVLDASGKITYEYEGYQPVPLQQAVAKVVAP